MKRDQKQKKKKSSGEEKESNGSRLEVNFLNTNIYDLQYDHFILLPTNKLLLLLCCNRKKKQISFKKTEKN